MHAILSVAGIALSDIGDAEVAYKSAKKKTLWLEVEKTRQSENIIHTQKKLTCFVSLSDQSRPQLVGLSTCKEMACWCTSLRPIEAVQGRDCSQRFQSQQLLGLSEKTREQVKVRKFTIKCECHKARRTKSIPTASDTCTEEVPTVTNCGKLNKKNSRGMSKKKQCTKAIIFFALT